MKTCTCIQSFIGTFKMPSELTKIVMIQLTFNAVYFFFLQKKFFFLKQNCIKFSLNKLTRVNKSNSNLVLLAENRRD